MRAYFRETQEMVFDAHDRAFAFIAALVGAATTNNMRTAVETSSSAERERGTPHCGSQNIALTAFSMCCRRLPMDTVSTR